MWLLKILPKQKKEMATLEKKPKCIIGDIF